MAFVDHYVAVVCDQIGNDVPTDKTLQKGDIDNAGDTLLSAMDDADLVRCEIEEGSKPGHPLVEKLAAMDQNQRIPSPRRNELRRDNGFAESCGGCQYAGVVSQKVHRGCFLLRRQCAKEAHPEWGTRLAFVTNFDGNSEIVEQT